MGLHSFYSAFLMDADKRLAESHGLCSVQYLIRIFAANTCILEKIYTSTHLIVIYTVILFLIIHTLNVCSYKKQIPIYYICTQDSFYVCISLTDTDTNVRHSRRHAYPDSPTRERPSNGVAFCKEMITRAFNSSPLITAFRPSLFCLEKI